jgi:hypothetical protein
MQYNAAIARKELIRLKQMFRILRIRIRWKGTDQLDSDIGSAAPSDQASERGVLYPLWAVAPWNWRVRVKWVGFGVASSTSPTQPTTRPIPENGSASPQRRVLGTLDLPKIRVRLSWVESQTGTHANALAWSVFVALLAIFVFTRLADVNNADNAFTAGQTQRFEQIAAEVSLNGEPIKITHSRLDIGQVKDLFDLDTVTLIRGREANPFVLDFEFPTPRAITGLVMDFGGMDFDLRVNVYGAEENQQTLYENEYRNQPPEPHVDLGFVDGPALVTRIYIEIEQYNPPDEPHIHVREVLFRE